MLKRRKWNSGTVAVPLPFQIKHNRPQKKKAAALTLFLFTSRVEYFELLLWARQLNKKRTVVALAPFKLE
jgi:hypothetical protein